MQTCIHNSIDYYERNGKILFQEFESVISSRIYSNSISHTFIIKIEKQPPQSTFGVVYCIVCYTQFYTMQNIFMYGFYACACTDSNGDNIMEKAQRKWDKLGKENLKSICLAWVFHAMFLHCLVVFFIYFRIYGNYFYCQFIVGLRFELFFLFLIARRIFFFVNYKYMYRAFQFSGQC